MVPLLRLLVPFVLFPVAAATLFRIASPESRAKLLAAVNILGLLGLCLVAPLSGLYLWQLRACLQIAVPVFGIYVFTVFLHYVLMRSLARKSGWIPWIAFLFPIAVMLAVKYLPAVSAPFREPLHFIGKQHVLEFFIGISYMAFRLSHLVIEVRNGVVAMPSIWEHFAFGLFVPTVTLGPISRYSVFIKSLYAPNRRDMPAARCGLRILTGLTKYLFLASLIEQLSYTGLLLDGHPHPWIDLPIAGVAFYIYLYLNFSGYCDMAIGTAGLLAIRVDENFDHPFQSRNIQEFWTRWHITLSTYMRDVLFSPMSKTLVRKLGDSSTPHVIALAIFSVFLAMGAWHGLAWNYLIYGALQGAGVVTCHYYTLWLKRRLGKSGYTAYHKNPFIRAAATALTFVFVAFTFFFFANSIGAERTILRLLR